MDLQIERLSTESLLVRWIEHDAFTDPDERARIAHELRSRGAPVPEPLPPSSDADEEPLVDDLTSAALASLERNEFGWYVLNRIVVFARLFARAAVVLAPVGLALVLAPPLSGAGWSDVARPLGNVLLLVAAALGARVLADRLQGRQRRTVRPGDVATLLLHPRSRNHRDVVPVYALELWTRAPATPGYGESVVLALAALRLSASDSGEYLRRSVELLDRLAGLGVTGPAARALAAMAAEALGCDEEAATRSASLLKEHPGIQAVRAVYARSRARLISSARDGAADGAPGPYGAQ